jgi:succinoglycan biosynthesis protein ExoO
MSVSPRISVVMAVYNWAAEIAGALESVFAQSFTDWELLIVDDASSDGTSAVIEQLTAGDPRVSLHRLAHNVGPGAARNFALGEARGEWVTVLDGDDAFEPDRLLILIERAIRDNLDLIADNLILYDEAVARALGPAFTLDGECYALTPRRLVENDCPPGMIVLGQLKPFVRRAFLSATGVRYPEDLRVGEDFQLLFELLEHTKQAALIGHCGYRYTLPFSPTAGRRSQGTRTSHGTQGLADLARGTARLIDRTSKYVRRDGRLISLLRKRQRRLRDEELWRRARSHVRAREYFAATWLLTGLDPIFGWAQAVGIYTRRRGRIQAHLR